MFAPAISEIAEATLCTHPVINLSGKQRRSLERRPWPGRKDSWGRFSRRHKVNRIRFPPALGSSLLESDVETESQVSAASCRLRGQA